MQCREPYQPERVLAPYDRDLGRPLFQGRRRLVLPEHDVVPCRASLHTPRKAELLLAVKNLQKRGAPPQRHVLLAAQKDAYQTKPEGTNDGKVTKNKERKIQHSGPRRPFPKNQYFLTGFSPPRQRATPETPRLFRGRGRRGGLSLRGAPLSHFLKTLFRFCAREHFNSGRFSRNPSRSQMRVTQK